MDQPEWVSLSEEALLERKIRSLHLTLAGSGWEPMVEQLYRELSERGLDFHPPCHIGDEWFCPVGVPAIYIPFFLMHPRLRKLERKMVLEVEGETSEWFMRLMRHEAAHAYSYAYNLYRKKKWQQCFGLASTEQADTYRPSPYSRSYVIHLDDWYAQSHPDEDFAETFAVWLTPGYDWRGRYRGWKALEKLEYVDGLMKSLAGKAPVHRPDYDPRDYDCLNIKLKTYYARKRKQYEEMFTEFYEKDLRRLFAESPLESGGMKASAYLRRHRGFLRRAVTEWTHERQYRVDRLVNDLIKRCDELGLYADEAQWTLPARLASYLTTLVLNHLFTGRFKRSK